MKLETTIKPRRDGVVKVELDKSTYIFAEVDGRLVADVANDAHVGHLLATGNFIPADESDFDAGLVAAHAVTGAADAQDIDGDDDEGDEMPQGGLPVESNTPPTRVNRKVK